MSMGRNLFCALVLAAAMGFPEIATAMDVKVTYTVQNTGNSFGGASLPNSSGVITGGTVVDGRPSVRPG